MDPHRLGPDGIRFCSSALRALPGTTASDAACLRSAVLRIIAVVRHDEQVELVDSIAERIQLLGGVSLAMAADVAETTQIERPPRGREEVPVQLSRLLDAHQVIIRETRKLARRASTLGDDGTNDLVVSEVLRRNELRVWFLSEHLVDVPLVKAEAPSVTAGAA